jgi:hypothetical protein
MTGFLNFSIYIYIHSVSKSIKDGDMGLLYRLQSFYSTDLAFFFMTSTEPTGPHLAESG